MGSDFSKKLSAAMLDAGLTQAELAQKLGVAQQQISMWKRGVRNPSDTSKKKLAQALGVPINFFIDSSINIRGNNNRSNIHSVGEVGVEYYIKKIELLERELEIERKEKELLLREKKK